MNASRPLPVIMPNVPAQRWSCHSCGNCCRTLVIHLSRHEREQIDRQGWVQKCAVAPYVRAGRGWALNKRSDGACVFLDERNYCRIHCEYGAAAKPFACRIYPFSVRPAGRAWQVSLRFDCPSVLSSKGDPINHHRMWLAGLLESLDHGRLQVSDEVYFERGLRATAEEVDFFASRISRWLRGDRHTLATRLTGAARITGTLADARFKKVRGGRFAELLDLLFGALPGECAVAPLPPTRRQAGMLRQLAFAHAEHITLAEMRARMRSRLRRRWRQLSASRRFLIAKNPVPRLPDFTGDVDFESVESVEPVEDRARCVEELLCRYVCARIDSRSVFGGGYYGWPVFTGMAALWLLVAVAGWLARFGAAVDARTSMCYEDVARALGIADRAATRLPALGAAAERARVSYLLKDDGVARLLSRCALASA